MASSRQCSGPNRILRFQYTCAGAACQADTPPNLSLRGATRRGNPFPFPAPAGVCCNMVCSKIEAACNRRSMTVPCGVKRRSIRNSRRGQGTPPYEQISIVRPAGRCRHRPLRIIKRFCAQRRSLRRAGCPHPAAAGPSVIAKAPVAAVGAVIECPSPRRRRRLREGTHQYRSACVRLPRRFAPRDDGALRFLQTKPLPVFSAGVEFYLNLSKKRLRLGWVVSLVCCSRARSRSFCSLFRCVGVSTTTVTNWSPRPLPLT